MTDLKCFSEIEFLTSNINMMQYTYNKTIKEQNNPLIKDLLPTLEENSHLTKNYMINPLPKEIFAKLVVKVL